MDESLLISLAEQESTPLITSELYTPNDFYGNATTLKEYACIPREYPLKATITHGGALGTIWDMDMNFPLPYHICFSPYRCQLSQSQTDKTCLPIGPYIQYATSFLDHEQIAREKERLGNSLLFFPLHSTHRVSNIYPDMEPIFNQLEEMKPYFDTIRVSLFWKDILDGAHKPYLERNFEVVTAGHMYNPLFLPRIKSLIECSTVTMSNIYGTYVPYSLCMNKPHVMRKAEFIQVADNDVLASDSGVVQKNSHLDECYDVFSDLHFDITPEQREFLCDLEGLNIKFSPVELWNVFSEMEKAYRVKGGSGIKKSDYMKRILFLGQQDKELIGSFARFTHSSRKNVQIKDGTIDGLFGLNLLKEQAIAHGAESCYAVIIFPGTLALSAGIFPRQDWDLLGRLSPQGSDVLNQLVLEHLQHSSFSDDSRQFLATLKTQLYELMRSLNPSFGPDICLITIPESETLPPRILLKIQAANKFLHKVPTLFSRAKVLDVNTLYASDPLFLKETLALTPHGYLRLTECLLHMLELV